MTGSLHNSLPSYGNPPLVETVLSVQFERLAKVTAAHLGAFWHQWREEWPEVQIQPPIESQIEVFDEFWLPQRLQLQFSQQPDIRLQMIGRDADRMIQLQRDRLAYNWRRQSGSYPRFDSLFAEFNRALNRLSDRLAADDLGEVRPRQWEVIYINHINKDALWQQPNQWADVLPALLQRPPDLPEGALLRGVQSQWVFDLAPRRGRLFIELSPRQTADKPPHEVLVLRLAARGPLDQVAELDDGFNLGHRTIVQSFDRLISAKAQQHWQRQ